jgi:hypothetical protein
VVKVTEPTRLATLSRLDPLISFERSLLRYMCLGYLS